MTQTKVIKHLLESKSPIEHVVVQGWVRTRRSSKGFSFIELNDGSCLKNLQIVLESSMDDYAVVETISTGYSVQIEGELIASPGKGQKWELKASKIAIVGDCPDDYPLQKKGHSPEFLREISHLRPRTNLFGCIFRVRSVMAYAIHRFFQERDFHYIHTPIITGSDCEGAGEMFKVTTLDPFNSKPEKPEADFFKRPTYLTVSGQLEAEIFATSLSRVYTFGPTFRAENSNTTRHASEFWMIEPEVAFCDLKCNMDLAEAFIQFLVGEMIDKCPDELNLFNKFVDKGLLERLKQIKDKPFVRVTYTEAVEILKQSGQKFEYPVEYGHNLQSEHERYLTEQHFKTPVTVSDYPKEIKPFYMRVNDDNKTVAAMDLLVPGIGEVIGGSQREERLDILKKNLERHGLSEQEYWWYTDLRKFGSVPHSGFGLGFERLLMLVTGVANIRDVIPFARTPGHLGF
jgi:asparaginyl-tRNA synthetase